MKNLLKSAARPSTASGPSSAELRKLLGDDQPRAWWQRRAVWLLAAMGLALVAGLYLWQVRTASSAAPSYVTEAVRRGNLTLNVMANGTLQPTRAVNIGSELSGTVKQVLVDVNDRVKKGQVLVELDTAKLSDQVLRSRATLAATQAQLALSTATQKEARANLARFEEVARLSGGKVPSATELDSARAAVDRAAASEDSARANVADARAALSTEEINLSKASIRSPIDGVVLARSVDPGNAVAASLQAVTLFSIAEDLKQLRLDVSVDEADVGTVQVGQKASFTVSAYPSRKYPAKVRRVAYGSTKTDNVITYTTYLDVDNSDLSLRPGMTAAAIITSVERTAVLLVPNTALRFTPSQAADGPVAAVSGGSFVSKLMPRIRMGGSGAHKAGAADAAAVRQIWVLKDGQAMALMVKTGISDGRMTEVSGEELQEGMAVITDQRSDGGAP
jgi:HlyD family secretion protein